MRVGSGGGNAIDGVLSGILPTEAFVDFAMGVAGRLSTSLCLESASASIATQLEQASDIVRDGTQDPTEVCDGISIGLGFSASRVQLGATTTAPAPPNPCVDS
jgi:hypothetical protein